MKGEEYIVYILASSRKGTLYVGVTNSLLRRIYEHKNESNESFTKKYKVSMLVFYESYRNIKDAIVREKQIKKWRRNWKIEMIEKSNPEWEDLYGDLNPIE